MAKQNNSSNGKAKNEQDKTYLSQSDFPLLPLGKSLKIARALLDEFGGRSATPHDIAIAIGIAPTSGGWRTLAGASVAYGLTSGGYNSKEISLAPLGQSVLDEHEGESRNSARTAIFKPRLLRAFYQKYDRAKYPSDHVIESVLQGLGVPTHRISTAVEILRENGIMCGVLRATKTGLFVAMEPGPTDEPRQAVPMRDDSTGSAVEPSRSDETPSAGKTAFQEARRNRIFVGHGKNTALLAQIKDLLAFGGFDPVVAVESETTAISVPEKVVEDMRSCSAGLLHIDDEETLIDKKGNERIVLNSNVLIEVGAARALYFDRIILLVKKGIQLPSNLQGLYRCEYDGDVITHDSTMKLLKAFTKLQGLLCDRPTLLTQQSVGLKSAAGTSQFH